MPNKKTLHFKTNVQLKSIIGKDLINDDRIAILELVKNSFDADAKTVDVTFLNLKTNDDDKVSTFSNSTSRIVIQDNGLGMDMSDVENKWLNIAYSDKKTNKRQHKRRMAGAKGVGRFSCDRLGEFLNLYAKTEKSEKYIKLTIDWKLFEVEDDKMEIQTIPLNFEELSKSELAQAGFKPFEKGVILEIIKLRSSWAYPVKDKNEKITGWNTEKFVSLKKYLEKLINPNQAFENDDFGVHIYAPEFINENDAKNAHDKFIGKVESRIFNKLDFKSTSIESKTLDSGRIIYTELKDKGKTIFWLKEKNPYFPFIKDVKVSIYFLNPYAKAFFTRQTGIQAVNYGSIFLFINGFRISPYGDVGNDWLRLDQRKAQGTRRYLGLRDIIGQIEILDENNDFQIISSREGIVKNDYYKNLTSSDRNDSFYYKAHRRLERYVVDGLNWDSSVYDGQNKEEAKKLREIEMKIVAGETSEDDLLYREDDYTKQRRTYAAIHSIISARTSDVLELYINEELITQKIDEERKRSEIEFKQLIRDFEQKRVDPDTLNRILLKKAEQNLELEKELKDLTKYSTNEATTKAILRLQDYKKTIEEQALLIESLKKQLEDLALEKQSNEKKVSSYKAKAEKAERDLAIEKEKNLYLLATRRTLSPDADGLIHTIKINNIEIRDGLDNLIDDITENDYIIKDVIKRLGHIKVNAERTLKMAEFATRSDLKEDIERRNIDIVKFIQEYVTLYGETFADEIEFVFELNDSQLTKNTSILNLSIALDNLINNAIKWGANTILFSFKNLSAKELSLTVSDDGVGLVEKHLNKPDRIFDLGVREQAPNGFGGSGIGLFYTRNLLEEMGNKIHFLGNGKLLSGAAFEIIFKAL
ncbi:ATP-binding protein [Winogradskyella sp.]|uniref:ATP-binding protein n=1 Tax=Winogradskyella sp. TaxID=1883156 RepID=UPI00261EACF2|nr:ATP-binding protein [Winogradskyella sp.]